MRDPVCGQELSQQPYVWSAPYRGQAFYFCSAACCRAFEQNPRKYARLSPLRQAWRALAAFATRTGNGEVGGGKCC